MLTSTQTSLIEALVGSANDLMILTLPPASSSTPSAQARKFVEMLHLSHPTPHTF
jgi:hypothetical protein